MSRKKDQKSTAVEPRGWYRFVNVAAAAATEADLYVYDVIGEWGWGDSVTAKKFVDDLKALPASVARINLHINSPGGSVFDAVAIANSLKAHRADVQVKIEGLAASAATIVAMAGDGISIAENALMMIHDPWALTVGNAKDMRAQADALDRVRDSIVATYQWHSPLDPEAIAKLMEDVTWMSAQEAVDQGFATEVGPAAKAAAHLDEATKAKIGAVPERFAAMLQDEAVEVRPQPVDKDRQLGANNDLHAESSKPRRKKPMAEETTATATVDERTFAEGKAEGLAEGSKAERERILGIDALDAPGQEALKQQLKAEGLSPGEAAIKLNAAAKATREQRLAAIRSDGQPTVTASVSETGDKPSVADDTHRPLEERVKAKWDQDAEIRAEFQDNFDSYLAFRKAEAQGRVRILRGGAAS